MRTSYICLSDVEAEEAQAAQPADGALEAAARNLGTLGEPTRMRIAIVLDHVGELCVGDTARLLELPIALVSHHMRTLAGAGLAESRRDGKLVRYRLTPPAVALLAAALQSVSDPSPA